MDLTQPANESKKQSQGTYGKEDDTKPKMIPSPEIKPTKHETKKTKAHWYKPIVDWCRAFVKEYGEACWKVVEILGIASAIFIAAITYVQWRDAKENFVLGQRGWVAVYDVSPNPEAAVANNTFSIDSVNLTMRNTGSTPALNVSVECCLYYNLRKIDPVPDWDNAIQHRNQFINFFGFRIAEANQQGVVPPGTQPQPRTFPNPDKTYPMLIPGDPRGMGVQRDPQPAYLYVLGQITYRDIFKNTPKHRTKFCFVHTTGTSFQNCSEGNFMD